MTPQAKPGFLFGGDSNMSYSQLQSRRKVADALMGKKAAPKSALEGLGHAAESIVGAMMNKGLDQREDALRAQFQDQFAKVAPAGAEPFASLLGNPMATEGHNKVLGGMMDKLPGFRFGTNFAPGGWAIVGEDGPEEVILPRGAQVIPNPKTENKTLRYLSQIGRDDLVRGVNAGQMTAREALSQISQEEAAQARAGAQRQQMPQAPVGGLPQAQSRFDDANAYPTADMSNVKPSGVGEVNQLNAAARSFQTLMKGLDDYERLFADGGSTAWPGQRKDALSTSHRNLQMQMKELYNLGVLNGPDLMLMDQILLDPTSVMGNVKDAMGIADMEQRIPDNIRNVRRMMTDLATPGLQQLGIDPQSLMPKEELSDEEFLKSLGLE